MTPCQKLLKQEGTTRRIESVQQSSATPKNHDVGRGLRKIVACSQSSYFIFYTYNNYYAGCCGLTQVSPEVDDFSAFGEFVALSLQLSQRISFDFMPA